MQRTYVKCAYENKREFKSSLKHHWAFFLGGRGFRGRGHAAAAVAPFRLLNCEYLKNGRLHEGGTHTIGISVQNSTRCEILIFDQTSPFILTKYPCTDRIGVE